MPFECKENEDLARATNSKDEFFSAESLFMVLILQQQTNHKRINCQGIGTERKKMKLVKWKYT
jgi:hypothetical protein